MNSPTPQATWLTEAQLRAQPVGSIPYDGGSQSPRFLQLPQAGYINALDIAQNLTGIHSVAPTSADVMGKLGGPIKQIRLFVNTEGEMYNLPGYISNLVMAMDDAYNMDDGRNYNWPLSSFDRMPGLNTFNDLWLYRIPLGLTLKDVPWPIGLYNTAIQNLTVQLQTEFLPIVATAGAPGSGLYLGGTLTTPAAAGNFDVNEQYFEPIPILQAQPPLKYIHRWTSFSVPITLGSGTIDIPLPGRQNYIRLIVAVIDGASSTTLTLSPSILTNLKLTYGVQTSPFDFTVNQLIFRERQLYGRLMDAWPQGVYFMDFIKETHTTRDWFNAGNVTNLRLQATLANAHTGVGSYFLVAAEEVLTLQGAGFNNTYNYLATQQAQQAGGG